MRFLVASFVILALIAGASLWALKNPDRYRQQMTRTIESTTGYHVTIAGDINWQYWPPIALSANNVSLATDIDSAPFAVIPLITFDLDLLALIKAPGTLDINMISIVDGVMTLVVDEKDDDNWTLKDTNIQAQDITSESTEDGSTIISKLSIRNLTIEYIDHHAATHIEANIDQLNIDNLRANVPFDISTNLIFRDLSNQIVLTTALDGQVIFNDSIDRVSLTNLTLNGSVTYRDTLLEGLAIQLSGSWQADESTIDLTSLAVKLADASLTIKLRMSLGQSVTQVSGQFQFSSTNLAKLAKKFGTDLSLSNASSSGVITATFGNQTQGIRANETPPDQLILTGLTGDIEDAKYKGKAAIIMGERNAIKADFRFDNLNLDGLLGLGSDVKHASPQAPQAQPDLVNTNSVNTEFVDSELIPLAALRAIESSIIIRSEQLSFASTTLSATKLEIETTPALLKLTANTAGLGGKIVLALDTSLQGPTTTTLTITMDDIDITALTDVEGLTGSLKGHSKLVFEGHMMTDLFDSLNGKTVFDISEGSLDVTPIKRIAQTIDSYRGSRSSISDWPDVMPFDKMTGEHVLNQGVYHNQFFVAELENLVMTGNGGIDPRAQTLNYAVTTMFNRDAQGIFKVGEQLSGIRWPLECKGHFSDEPLDLCLGQEGAIGNLVSDILKQDIKRRGDKKIEQLVKDKIPEEYKELTRELFKKLIK